MRPALLAALLLIACGRREPAPDACARGPSSDRSGVVTVRAEIPPATLRHELDLAGLARLSGGAVGSGRPQGLTEVEDQLTLRTTVRTANSRGRSCAWFETLGVDLSPASVAIYVPSEYAENTCEYAAVLAHEREHEDAHRERLQAAAAEVQAALAGAPWLPTRGNPMSVGDASSARDVLNAKTRELLNPIYARFKDELRAQHAFLDKPELYQWASKRCGGWK